MSSLKPLKDSIIFTFVQNTQDGYFRNETDWGLQISGSDYDSTKARWGKVEEIGPDCKDVTVGQYILIEPLKWTTAIEYERKSFWRTAESEVMLVSDEKPKDVT